MNKVLKLKRAIKVLLVSILTISISITTFASVLVYAADDDYVDSDQFDIDFQSPTPVITVSKDIINESDKNDGSIGEQQIVTLKNSKFVDGISAADVLVNNLPEGINIVVSKDSDTQITVNFNGNAVNNTSDSNISNANIKVSMNKVSGATSDLVTGNFSFNFKDPTDSDIIAIDKAALQVGFKYGDSQDSVTGNVFLSTTSTNGSKITWSSSDIAVITNAGIVKMPAYTSIKEDYIEVKLTANIEKGGVTDKKEFTLKVRKQNPSSQEAVDIDTSKLSIVYADGDSENSVTKSLTLSLGEQNGTQISWSSDNSSVIGNDGTVTRPVFTTGDKIVNLTATITKGTATATKKFTNIKVIKLDITDEEAVELDKKSLSIIYSQGDNKNNVTQNVTIPGAGENVSKIMWSSDENLVISNTGVVTRPTNSSGDKTVTLTATITKGKAIGTVIFVLKVMKLPQDSVTTPVPTATPTPSQTPVPVPIPTPIPEQGDTGVDIIVNGKVQTAATACVTKNGDKTVATITVDDKKVNEKLESEGNKATVIIPVNKSYDVIVGILNAQTVKNMEQKEAVLEIKTENVSYTLPASQINIDDVSKQIGKDIALKDIKVSVSIAKSGADTVKVVEDTANKNKYNVVVKPVDFEVTCINGNKAVYVNKFNSYVERMIAMPDVIDPSKITTGIVLNSDGTFSHVPTLVTKIDGKYYAKINSLTNSAYSVIYSPKTFSDVEKHWAKNDINDMASRLIINGVGNGDFEPNRDITRAEFASIIVKGLGLMRSGTGKDCFSDVNKNDWYYDAVSIANEYELIKGVGKNSFEPKRNITREEAMAVISRAMVISKLKTDLTADEVKNALGKFGDSSAISEWAKAYIAACVSNGIVNGSNGKITAKQNITRAEVAAIIERMLQKSNLINTYSSK